MTLTSDTPQPQGDLLLKTVAMPADTNPNGDIFGGWILAQMDLAGGILAKEIAKGRVATIAIDAMKFIKPVKVGDIVCCYGRVGPMGTTSLTLHLETWVIPIWRADENKQPFRVTEANFTYVAIDLEGKKRPLKPE